MAASKYEIKHIWDELDRSVNEALARKYMRMPTILCHEGL